MAPAVSWSIIAPLFLLVLLAAVGLLVALVVRRMRRRDVTDPACGKCGYAVRGLPSFICPECGSDLREVGIVTPLARRPAGLWPRVLLWTLVLPWPAMFLSAMAMRSLMPHEYEQQNQRVIFGHLDYFQATLTAHATGKAVLWGGRRWNVNVPLQQLSLDMSGPSGSHIKLSADLGTKVWQFTDRQGRVVRGTGLGPEMIVALAAAAAGCDGSDPRVRARASDAWSAVQKMLQLGGPPGSGSSDFFKDENGQQVMVADPATIWYPIAQPVAWATPALWGWWIAVWLGGVLLLARRQRRRRAAMAALAATTV